MAQTYGNQGAAHGVERGMAMELQGYDLSDAQWVWDEMLDSIARHAQWAASMSERHECGLSERLVGN